MSTPFVSAYDRIPDDCPMSCTVTSNDDLELLLGTPRDGFELVLRRDGLARLVELGQRILAAEHPAEPSAIVPTFTSSAVA